MNNKLINSPEDLLGDLSTIEFYKFENFIDISSNKEISRSKKRVKLLRVVHPVVSEIIEEDEQVLYITRGLRISNLDQLFIGAIAYYYNLFTFVFTNKRILLVHLSGKFKRGQYLGEIKYQNVMSFAGKFRLRIKFKNGRSILLTRIPHYDRKYLLEFVKTAFPGKQPKEPSLPGIEYLCPSCYCVVKDFPKQCESCDARFKTRTRAAAYSLLFPGLGDIYLGSKILGTLEMTWMSFIWLLSILAIISGELDPETNVGAYISTLLFIHMIDALKSAYLAEKGIALAKRKKKRELN